MLELAPGFVHYRGWCDTALDIASLPLKQTTVRVYGKEHATPRLVAWMGEASYTYAGQTHEPAAMPGWLATMRTALAHFTRAKYNSVLANYYRDGRDSVAWHADDETELGKHPTIASISLGGSRRFGIKYKSSKATQYVTLEHGDLLVMSGDAQRDYLHCVPKTSAFVAARLNLTFRHISK